jgi:alpha-glucosidase (family GH31 glycosyl hydrolase)
VLRVDLLPSRTTSRDSSLAVTRTPDGTTPVSVDEPSTAPTVSTSGLTVRVQKAPVRLRVRGPSGAPLLDEPDDAGFVASGPRRRAQFALPPGLRFYGTGERGLDLNLRGTRFRSENTQRFGYDQPLPTMNINVPLLLTSGGYALLFDTPYPGTFDLGAQDPSRFSYEADGGELSYFVLAGPDVPAQLERYTWLTGRPPMPPKWALGYLQSKYGYRSAEAARSVVDQLRAHDIPADGLILDLYWFEHMGDLSWDASAFPSPEAMIDDFEAQGIKTLVITEPYVTEPSQWFSAHTQPGAPRAAQAPDGSAYRLSNWWSCGGCDAVLSDMTHGPTRAWWQTRYDEILADGVHGLWTDLGEPEAHPADMQHAGGPAAAVHNVYNLLWTRTAHDAFTDRRPNRRFVNLTRAGFAGIQRYGAFTWSADVARSFDGLAVQRPILLNSSLSGLYYHSSDVGGFVGSTAPELYIRWLQMGAFTPVLRPHGVDTAPTEPWRLDAPTLSISRRYVKLRYRLLPYLYTMAHRAHERGMPIVRPLFFQSSGGRWAEEDDAYLFGDSFLVAPVVERDKTTKTVPLPAGAWVNYWTDAVVEGGGTVTVDAPLERLPLFVREGAIIPMRPSAPAHVGHSVADTLELAVYPSADGGSFTLYEDDGHTRAYEQGAFATTRFTQQLSGPDTAATLTLRLGPTQGTFSGRPDERTYHVVAHQIDRPPRRVTLDGRSLPERPTPAALRTRPDGYAYDSTAQRLHVRTRGPVTAQQEIRAPIAPPQSPSSGAGPTVSPDSLGPPSPNPVRSSATLYYSLSTRSRVTLRVYDALGRRVATVVDGVRDEGPHRVRLAPGPRGLASGLYVYRIVARRPPGSVAPGRLLFRDTRKMVITR